MRSTGRLIAVLAIVATALAAGLSTASAKKGSRYRAPVTGDLGVVATESPAAGRVGRQVLENGGNAVDAATSIVFALNVARPQSCGIGGGGFMVYRGANGRTATLDFRETAPARFTPKTLTTKGLHEDFTGHLTVGVPGTLAGMNAALRRYGTLSLKQAIAPAERLARSGVRVQPSLARTLAANAPRIKKYPTTARQFLPNGKAPKAGSVLRQRTLARTLRTIQRDGTRAFYRGSIARQIAADMASTRKKPIKGDKALLTSKDLARYRPVWRTAVTGTFRDSQVIGMPPPTSGGVTTLELLNILEGFDNRASGMSSVDTLHRIIEAEKLAFADRNAYLADPKFVKQPVATLTSKAYAAKRRALINPAKAATKVEPGLSKASTAKAPESNEASTTHVSVLDAKGNAVSLTCTIEQELGSAVVAPGTGFLLNNEMTDFGKPGTANQPEPGKRPRSSMNPLIVTQAGRPIAVTGGAGGSRIIMGSFFAAFNRMEFGLPLAEAVDAERVDANDFPDKPVHVEQTRLAPGVLAGLEARGQKFDLRGEYDIVPSHLPDPAGKSGGPRVQAVGYRAITGGGKDAVSDSRTELGSYGQRVKTK